MLGGHSEFISFSGSQNQVVGPAQGQGGTVRNLDLQVGAIYVRSIVLETFLLKVLFIK